MGAEKGGKWQARGWGEKKAGGVAVTFCGNRWYYSFTRDWCTHARHDRDDGRSRTKSRRGPAQQAEPRSGTQSKREDVRVSGGLVGASGVIRTSTMEHSLRACPQACCWVGRYRGGPLRRSRPMDTTLNRRGGEVGEVDLGIAEVGVMRRQAMGGGDLSTAAWGASLALPHAAGGEVRTALVWRLPNVFLPFPSDLLPFLRARSASGGPFLRPFTTPFPSSPSLSSNKPRKKLRSNSQRRKCSLGLRGGPTLPYIGPTRGLREGGPT